MFINQMVTSLRPTSFFTVATATGSKVVKKVSNISYIYTIAGKKMEIQNPKNTFPKIPKFGRVLRPSASSEGKTREKRRRALTKIFFPNSATPPLPLIQPNAKGFQKKNDVQIPIVRFRRCSHWCCQHRLCCQP